MNIKDEKQKTGRNFSKKPELLLTFDFEFSDVRKGRMDFEREACF